MNKQKKQQFTTSKFKNQKFF